MTAAMAPAGYKASEPMLMWEALRQATDEVRALSRPHAAHFMAAGPAGSPRRGGGRPRPTQELERDPTVMVMGEDVGHYGGSYKARRAPQPVHLSTGSDAPAAPRRR